jgi:hypothetical protein
MATVFLRPVAPFQGFGLAGEPTDPQGVALGCHVVAPLGRREPMRNIKTRASG